MEHGEPSAAAIEMERDLEGWVRPIAHGLCVVRSGERLDEARFPVVNVAGHYLVAAVLGTVTGRRAGTCTVALSAEQLRRAMELDAPSNADPTLHHPNSAWWAEALALLESDAGARAFVVFVDDLADRPSSEADARLRAQIAAGDRAPYRRDVLN